MAVRSYSAFGRTRGIGKRDLWDLREEDVADHAAANTSQHAEQRRHQRA
jgi:hypothetical protein